MCLLDGGFCGKPGSPSALIPELCPNCGGTFTIFHYFVHGGYDRCCYRNGCGQSDFCKMDGRAVKEKPLHVPCRGSVAGVLVLWTGDPFVKEGMRKDPAN